MEFSEGKLKVPIGHYLYFWTLNTLMAIGTGLILGLMALRVGGVFLLSPISFPAIFGVAFQGFAVSYFFGKRRGAFEYSYLERSTRKGADGSDLAKCLKEVKQELKLGDPVAADAKLKKALKEYSNHLVVNFKSARSSERMGLGREAIEFYRDVDSLLQDEAIALKDYVARQIERVQKKGPTRRSTAPGLQYVLY